MSDAYSRCVYLIKKLVLIPEAVRPVRRLFVESGIIPPLRKDTPSILVDALLPGLERLMDLYPEKEELEMVASQNTILLLVDLIQKYIPIIQMNEFLNELQEIPGNASFRQTVAGVDRLARLPENSGSMPAGHHGLDKPEQKD